VVVLNNGINRELLPAEQRLNNGTVVNVFKFELPHAPS